MEKKWCVYVHIAPNGKKYVGITSQKPEKRWNHGEGYQRHPYFYSAIKKYKWDNFQHIILFDNLNEETAERMEQLCITILRTHIQKYGYNLSLGGRSGSYGSKKTEKQKQHLREINTGKKLSSETIEKMKKAKIGKTPNLSDERKEYLKNNFIYNNPNSREVYCYETDTIYISGSYAARELKLTCRENNVTRCCRKEIKSVQGYHFCFAEEKDTFDFEAAKTNNKKRKVYCYETDMIYESASEAARQVLKKNTNVGIIKNCKKQQKSCCGYHFCYAEEREVDKYAIVSR